MQKSSNTNALRKGSRLPIFAVVKYIYTTLGVDYMEIEICYLNGLHDNFSFVNKLQINIGGKFNE